MEESQLSTAMPHGADHAKTSPHTFIKKLAKQALLLSRSTSIKLQNLHNPTKFKPCQLSWSSRENGTTLSKPLSEEDNQMLTQSSTMPPATNEANEEKT
jgi:hypothetical protein